VNQTGTNALVDFANNASGGSFTVSEDLTLPSPFANAGSMVISKSYTLTLSGATPAYNQTGGTTTVDGTLSVPAGSINISGGTLAGTGTIAGDVSVGATLVAGNSATKAGLLTLSNNYTQLATGVMDVQIGGTEAGAEYSRLNVTGPVALNGTLNIALIGGFSPQLGQSFTILHSPSGVTGTFSTVNGTSINSSEHFHMSYTSAAVVLTVVSGS
jgi:hypothetical protein